MSSTSHKRIVLGLLLVVVGSLFLADNLGFPVEIPYFLFSWPAVFVVIGAVNLLSGNKRAAFIFFSLAIVFYLHYYRVIHLKEVWPVIIILVGLSFIFKGKQIIKKANESNEHLIDEMVIFGGTEKKFVSDNLQGGKITTVFGGSEIDMTEAGAQEGAVIEIFCMFGGVELRVPDDWQVNMNATAIFGGFTDDRKHIAKSTSVTVNINGFVIFGGGELKN